MEKTQCPLCSGPCFRDKVDIGVGIQYGPWQCLDCFWCEGEDHQGLLKEIEE